MDEYAQNKLTVYSGVNKLTPEQNAWTEHRSFEMYMYFYLLIYLVEEFAAMASLTSPSSTCPGADLHRSLKTLDSSSVHSPLSQAYV